MLYKIKDVRFEIFNLDLETFPPLFKAQVLHHKLEASKTGLWQVYAETAEMGQEQTARVIRICTKECVDPSTLYVVGRGLRLTKKDAVRWKMWRQSGRKRPSNNEEEAA